MIISKKTKRSHKVDVMNMKKFGKLEGNWNYTCSCCVVFCCSWCNLTSSCANTFLSFLSLSISLSKATWFPTSTPELWSLIWRPWCCCGGCWETSKLCDADLRRRRILFSKSGLPRKNPSCANSYRLGSTFRKPWTTPCNKPNRQNSNSLIKWRVPTWLIHKWSWHSFGWILAPFILWFHMYAVEKTYPKVVN